MGLVDGNWKKHVSSFLGRDVCWEKRGSSLKGGDGQKAHFLEMFVGLGRLKKRRGGRAGK